MDPSVELIQLLCDIRDDQRELLALLKASKERAEQQYREQQDARAEYQAYAARDEAAKALWIQANERQQRIGKRIGVAVLVVLVIGATVVGILAALGWIS